MKTSTKLFLAFILIVLLSDPSFVQAQLIELSKTPYKIYPNVNDAQPALPSPFTDRQGVEYVIAVTKNQQYAIIPVTLSDESKMGKQLIIDEQDFPALAKNGLHSMKELNQIKTITGWSLSEITELGRPKGLSHDGFMAEDEDILSVIKSDNRIVSELGLTHPELAKPLFHVLNMMDADLSLNRWNMARHRWENIKYFFYNDQTVFVDAEDTKGGQKSIFDDNIEGAFYIRLRYEIDEEELQFLQEKYGHLPATQFETLKTLLSVIHTGEMEPQYIMRYGFYEGHTFWRTDPIAISFIFGLKTLPDIEKTYPGKLFYVLTNHFTHETK